MTINNINLLTSIYWEFNSVEQFLKNFSRDKESINFTYLLSTYDNITYLVEVKLFNRSKTSKYFFLEFTVLSSENWRISKMVTSSISTHTTNKVDLLGFLSTLFSEMKELISPEDTSSISKNTSSIEKNNTIFDSSTSLDDFDDEDEIDEEFIKKIDSLNNLYDMEFKSDKMKKLVEEFLNIHSKDKQLLISYKKKGSLSIEEYEDFKNHLEYMLNTKLGELFLSVPRTEIVERCVKSYHDIYNELLKIPLN